VRKLLRRTLRLALAAAILGGLGASIRRLSAGSTGGTADTWPPVPLAPRDPARSDPVRSDPAEADPIGSTPASRKPASRKPASTKPTPNKPASTKPTPSKRAGSTSALSDPPPDT
jgi:hypothetical protein